LDGFPNIENCDKANNNEKTGMRQRKGGSSEIKLNSKWTRENIGDKEEESLRETNPIKWLGHCHHPRFEACAETSETEFEFLHSGYKFSYRDYSD